MTLAEFREKQAKALARLRNEEIVFLYKALVAAGGNLAQAARDLDITPQALQLRMNKLDMRAKLAKVRALYEHRQGIKQK